jgi:hypothetical protein
LSVKLRSYRTQSGVRIMQPNSDASRIIEIKGSPVKLLLLIAVGLLLIGAGAFAILQPDAPLKAKIAGYVGVPFFGLCLVVAVQRLIASSGTVITISSLGIRDTRVAAKFIPWSDVTGIGTWAHSGQKSMVLAVAPSVQDRLELNRSARWSRGPNKMMIGYDGLWITSLGLKIDYNTLLQTCGYYWQAHRGTRMPREPRIGIS